MADDSAELLGYVLAAELPPEEPLMAWWRWADSNPTTTPEHELKVRSHDHALLVGACEYHVDTSSGIVDVKDYTDPRSMRFQRYDPARPGQPYMAPSIEDDVMPSTGR